MASIELGEALKSLKAERVKLNAAIAALEGLYGTGKSLPVANGNSGKRIMSAAARRKIAKAQKLRWAKFRAQKKVKT